MLGRFSLTVKFKESACDIHIDALLGSLSPLFIYADLFEPFLQLMIKFWNNYETHYVQHK